MTKDASAPGGLELIRSFVNSIDLERPETLDALADLGAARLWLADAGLDPAGLAPAALPDLRRLRETLRSVLLAHNGEGDEQATWRQLVSQFSAVRLDVRFAAVPGEVELEPSVPAGGEALRGALAAAVYDAVRDGTWRRLKACRKHSCLYAFYDKTKNGSGTWCSMDTCGNRVKAQRRRARERDAAT
ncbi:MAG TPA: CGNR zinc finger domain-containing protein [Candidatus Acidoferrum sp.]|nr:CGNR zinc finger domain-containing protein [Candidatus Acidoferrum sp.]